MGLEVKAAEPESSPVASVLSLGPVGAEGPAFPPRCLHITMLPVMSLLLFQPPGSVTHLCPLEVQGDEGSGFLVESFL